MDNIAVKDVILDKKMSSYDYENNLNLIASGEITVTITLAEYRKLVADNATTDSRIKKAENDKYERDNENKKLKESNDALKAEIYELKKKLESYESAVGEPCTESTESKKSEVY